MSALSKILRARPRGRSWARARIRSGALRSAAARVHEIHVIDHEGPRLTLRQRVLIELRASGHAGMTCNELGARVGHPASSVTGRLADLERDGLAFRRGVLRKSEISKVLNEVWTTIPPATNQIPLERWSS